jgi:hypothetical protein
MAVIQSIGTVNQSINVDKLTGFARDFGAEIFTQLLNDTEFVTHFPTETDITSERSYLKLNVDATLGPYTGKLDNEGDEANYSHRKLGVTVGQSVLAVDPESLRYAPHVIKTLQNITGGKVYQEGLILAEFIKSLQAKLNDYTFYKGDTAITATTKPQKAMKMANGLEKVILACIAATEPTDKLTPVVTPAFNPGVGYYPSPTNWGNMIESFEAVDNGFTAADQKRERTIFCAIDVFKNYKNNFKLRHGNDPRLEYYDGGIHEFIYLGDTDKRCKIAPATWLGTSNRIIDVIDGSIRVGTDVAGMLAELDIQKLGFLYYYFTKAIFGVQIVNVDGVRINSLS